MGPAADGRPEEPRSGGAYRFRAPPSLCENPRMLIGRGPQRAAIDQVLADATRRRQRRAGVQREPGIGKTALLDYAAEQAAGMLLLRARGSIGGAHPIRHAARVIRPMLALLGRLAEPQVAALEQAFALRPGPNRDRFAIGAATLGLLAAAAEEQPLVLLLDDVQWFDVPSSEALRFALRRLKADPLAAIVAVREGHASLLDDSGISTLALEGLSASEARLLRPDVPAERPRGWPTSRRATPWPCWSWSRIPATSHWRRRARRCCCRSGSQPPTCIGPQASARTHVCVCCWPPRAATATCSF